MSAKDAKGVGKLGPNFESPNFESADEEEKIVIDTEAEERRKRETVDIDGIPIDDNEVKFRAEDIKKKKKQEYFVNVEGAEKRAREAAKQARAEQIAEEKELKAEAVAEEKAKKEKELAAKKKDEDLKKTLLGKAHQRRKENAEHEKAVKKEISRKKREERRAVLYKIFLKGWRKFVTFGVIALAVALPILYFTTIKPAIEISINNAEYAAENDRINAVNEYIDEAYSIYSPETNANFDKACKYFEEKIEELSGSDKFYLIIAYSNFMYSRGGDSAAAAEIVRQAESLAETNSQKGTYYRSLAIYYEDLEEVELAEENYAKANEVDPIYELNDEQIKKNKESNYED